MGTYRVSLLVGFTPALSIARQQKVMDAIESLHPHSVDFTDAGCAVELTATGSDSESARNEAEYSLAHVLFEAGHTMRTAPITTTGVAQA